MRIGLAALLLFIGLVSPLMLNGQEFTNELLDITFAVGAIIVGLDRVPSRKKRAGPEPGLGVIVAGLSGLLIVILLTQLPSAYRVQREFNRSMKQARQRMEPKVRGEQPHSTARSTTEASGPTQH